MGIKGCLNLSSHIWRSADHIQTVRPQNTSIEILYCLIQLSSVYTKHVQYRSKVSYHPSSRFSRDESLVSRDESLVSRDETLVSRDETLVSRESVKRKFWNKLRAIILREKRLNSRECFCVLTSSKNLPCKKDCWFVRNNRYVLSNLKETSD